MKNILETYSSTIKSFHMPGHKNGQLQLIDNLYHLDVTEVEGTDDLHHSKAMLKEAMTYIANIYGADHSYMLVNGSTGGILAAISSVVQYGDHIIIGRNCHKSVYSACLINGLNPSYISPSFDEGVFYSEISSRSVAEAMAANDKAKVVVITSPTYEGIVSDIQAIARQVHDYDGILIVDEAHGSHLIFSDQLPQSAIELGADLVIQSTHKTLPCLTQTGVLHVSHQGLQSNRLNLSRLERFLSIYQSSSPSYVLMTSIYEGIKYMDEHRNDFDRLIRQVKVLRQKYKGWFVPGQGVESSLGYDYLRMVYKTEVISGSDIEKQLRSDYHIQVELSSIGHIVAIVTVADKGQDVEGLMQAVETIVNKAGKTVANDQQMHQDEPNDRRLKASYRMDPLMINQPEKAMTLTKAMDAKRSFINLDHSLNRTSADFVVPYPPGIPLLAPGEIISPEILNKIRQMVKTGKDVYGLNIVKNCGIMDIEIAVIDGGSLA